MSRWQHAAGLLRPAPAAADALSPAGVVTPRRTSRKAAWTLVGGTVAINGVNTLYLLLCAALGLVTMGTVWTFTAMWGVMAIVCGLITLKMPRSWMGWSQRALLHLSLVSAPGFVAGYLIDESAARHAFSIFTMMALFGGLLWLSARQMMALASVIVCYQVVQYIAMHAWAPERLDGVSDLVSAVAYLAAGVQVAYLGGLIFSMDARLRKRTVELDDAVAQIDRLSRTDELTGCYNRRHLLEYLEASLRSPASDPQRAVAVLLMDMDHFKRVNDTLGHPVGDVVLQRFAACVTACMPPDAMFGRYGGEEFLVIAPGRTGDEALVLADALRAAVSVIAVDDLDPSLRLSCSVGIALAQGVEGSDELLAAADQALYQAKAAGRDRAVLHGVVGPASERSSGQAVREMARAAVGGERARSSLEIERLV